MEIVQFIVALWSHHHYKQSESRPLLDIGILYTVEIHLIIPIRRWKKGWSQTEITCEILWSLLLQLRMVTD